MLLILVGLSRGASAREIQGQLTGTTGAYTSEKAEIEALVSGSIARNQTALGGPVTILNIVSPAEWNTIAKQLIAGGVPVRDDGVPYSLWLIEFRTNDGRTLWGDGSELESECLGGGLDTGPHAALAGCGHTPTPVSPQTIYLTAWSVCPGTKRMIDAAQRNLANTVDSARRWMEVANKLEPCGRAFVSNGNKQQATIIFGTDAMYLGWASDELYHTDHRSGGRQLLDSAKSKFAYAKGLAGTGIANQSLGGYYQSGIQPAEQDYVP